MCVDALCLTTFLTETDFWLNYIVDPVDINFTKNQFLSKKAALPVYRRHYSSCYHVYKISPLGTGQKCRLRRILVELLSTLSTFHKVPFLPKEFSDAIQFGLAIKNNFLSPFLSIHISFLGSKTSFLILRTNCNSNEFEHHCPETIMDHATYLANRYNHIVLWCSAFAPKRVGDTKHCDV